MVKVKFGDAAVPTASAALAVVPVSASAAPPAVVALMASVVLVWVPVAVAVTLKVTLHDVLAASETLVSRTPTEPPASELPALSVGVTPQVLVVMVVLASVIAPGNVGNTSRIVIPLTVPGFAAGLVMVSVSTEIPPEVILAGVKLLVTVGGVYTFSVAEAAAVLLPAFVAVTPPMGIVLT